ncbi:hypothetical protein MKD33_19260, partial [Chromobacterium piscinae]
SSQID